MSTAVKVLAFGAAGYVAYRWLLPQLTSSAPSTTPGVTPAAIAPSQLDVIYPKMLAAAAAESKMTAAAYWAGMAPYLKAHAGFTGLGFFGNLCCGGGRS